MFLLGILLLIMLPHQMHEVLHLTCVPFNNMLLGMFQIKKYHLSTRMS